jgi:molybdenum cofactor synthesis domain-containing protein
MGVRLNINSPETIARILDECLTIAVVGLSSSPSRPSHGVAAYMQRVGYRVIPVNPNETEVLGERAHHLLADVPEKIDLVDVFRRPEEAGSAVDQAIAIGAKAVWLQEGVIDYAAAQRALEAGLLVVMDRCWLKEHAQGRRQKADSPITSMSTQIHAVVITASDACSQGEREDKSGEMLVTLLTKIGAHIVAKEILTDELEPLSDKLREYADRPDVNLILTTGGTGFGPRDNTPEATLRVIAREAPGLVEAMRIETLKHTPMAMISRGVCGIRSGTLIVNLPGSPRAVTESFAVIKPVLSHAVELLAGETRHDKRQV